MSTLHIKCAVELSRIALIYMMWKAWAVVLLFQVCTSSGSDESNGKKVDLGVEFPPELHAKLPTVSEVSELYGPLPVMGGIDRCEAYRDAVAPEDRLLAIAGLYNTGTNLITKSLQENCRMPKIEKRRKKHGSFGKNKYDDGILGAVFWHKHAPLSYRNTTFSLPRYAGKSDYLRFQGTLPVVMVKDPVFWISSMCRHSYDVKMKNRTDCPRLLDIDNNPIPARGKLRPFMEPFQYDSLVDMWNKFYLDYESFEQPRIMIRYEDVLFHGEEVVKQICACAGGTIRSGGYAPHVEFSKPNQAVGLEYDRSVYLAEAASKYGRLARRKTVLRSSRDRSYVEQTLDGGLMDTFNYRKQIR